MDLKQTPLSKTHESLGATMVDFAGWYMPMQYESIVKEHAHVRSAVGMFDVSHMGEIDIHGPGAIDFCQKVTCNDVSKLKPGKVQYNALLNEEGGMIDDCTVYMFNQEHFMFVVNASRKENVLNWLFIQQNDNVEITDRSDDFALLSVQGPKSPQVVSEFIARDVQTITYYEFQVCNVFDHAVIVSRTGYTGEDGFEVYIPTSIAQKSWDALIELGASVDLKPIGLGARDILRLEMGYRLYGSDMDESVTPFEAGLSWIVDMDKGSFLGNQALRAQKEAGGFARLRGLLMQDKGIPRHGYKVYEADKEIGVITSGTFSPGIKKGIALASLQTKSKIGSEVLIDIRGRKVPAKIVRTPFVEGSVKK